MDSSNTVPRAGARRFRLAAIAAAAILAVDALWRVFGFGGAWPTKVWSDVIDIPVTIAAAAVCFMTAGNRVGPSRRAWRLVGAGMLAWGAGEVVWAFYELVLRHEVPFPSPADAGYLLLIPLLGAGLLSFPLAPRSFKGKSRLVLDGIIIATSMFAVSWNLILGPMYRAGDDGSILKQALGLAYPFGDMALIGIVLFVGARAARSQRRTVALIAAGVVSIAVADSLFNYFTLYNKYSSSNVLGIGWTAGWLLIALGAIGSRQTTTRSDDGPTTKTGALLPYVAIVIGVPIQIVKFIQTGRFDPVVFGVGIALFAAVSVRQLVTVLENRALAADLEVKVRERTAELEHALDQLREAAVRQEEFVSHASHELFTPLTTLVGSIDLLSDPSDATFEQAPNLLRMAGDAARRMTHLVDDLMLATGLNGFVACDQIPFDVPARIRLALANFDAPNKTVHTRIVEGISAAGDPERFQTALGHILSNADKFSPSGSTICIEARQDGDDVVVIVSDEGPGVSPEFREIAFERFSQVDGSDTRRHDGLGLGLFLARQVVRAMGGEVSFDDVDSGCSVRVALPRSVAGPGSGMSPATSGVRRMYG